MKRLLILTGDVAAGKSTFAEILSKRYQTNVFYKDKIKEVLGDVIGIFQQRRKSGIVRCGGTADDSYL